MVDPGNRLRVFVIKKIEAIQTSVNLLAELEIQAIEVKLNLIREKDEGREEVK